MIIKYIIGNFVIAAAYIIGGQAGLLLAIPPSNAAAVWPAAGIALASLSIYGVRVLPGVFFGALIVQTASYLDTSDIERIYLSLLIGGVIAAGATFQAWAGAKLTDPLMKRDGGLLKEQSIFSYFLLAGPISCIISATVGVGTLWYLQIISDPDLLSSWVTWWIGDSIGVFVFVPVILCLFAKPHHLWRPRIISIALPLFILSGITFSVFNYSNQQELDSIESQFERDAIQFINELKHSLSSNLEATHELKEFFDNSNDISADTFQNYATPKLERNPGIQALEWIPKILHVDRTTFEDGLGEQIKIRNQNSEMITSSAKDYYFPIQYLVPYTGNENASGFDIRSNEAAFAAVEAACKSGQVTVTDAINLVQDTIGQLGIVFYAPVYNKTLLDSNNSGCEAVEGVVASVFKLEFELNNIKTRLSDINIIITLVNNSEVFYSDNPAIQNQHTVPTGYNLERIFTFPIANQEWEIILAPSEGIIAYYNSWGLWAVIVGGLFITGMAGMALLLLTGKTFQTEDRIRDRTRELDSEIAQRNHVTSLLALENKYLEMISQDYSMQEILESITTAIDEMIPEAQSSILLLDPAGKYLKHCSAPNLPKEYMKMIDGEPIGPKAGSCGTAAYLNRQVIVSDIATDPLWDDYRDIALKFGLRACWSTPITVAESKVLGTFAIYFQTVKDSESNLIDLVNTVAKIAAITILRKQSEEQLVYQASHDSLTGLVNRYEFEQRLKRALITVKQGVNEHALYYMDLDQFKIVNDRCGHTAGDEMLKQITSVLQKVMRKGDTLARLGGDEFGVLMEYCSLDDAHRVANSFQKAINEYQFTWEGQSFRAGVSIGLVPIVSRTTTLTRLLKDADAACFMAKDLGRNRIHTYHRDDENLVKRSGEMKWVSQIHRAIDEDRFCLYAQTIVPLDGSNEQHYELLIRMINEEGEIVPPGFFLPSAERYNLITELDNWVIKKAFTTLAEYPVFLESVHFCSINLSGQSVTSPKILNYIIELLDQLAIEKSKICFEITETTAIANLNLAIKFISTLKELGCQFALDDFGSGLSSFGYLKNLPVDYLKIDGMFVKDITEDPINHAMVKSINDIGHVMGMKTIAEFVENDDIQEILTELGVDYAQGYGIGKPQALINIINNKSSKQNP